MEEAESNIIRTMEETTNSCKFDKLFMISVPHILEKIFFSLDYASLKASREVCKRWYELMSTEAYQNNLQKVKDKEVDLFWYSWLGDPAKIQELLSSGTDPNCKKGYALRDGVKHDFHGETPLNAAVSRLSAVGCQNVVEVLLNAGADPNTADCNGNTPLSIAAEKGLINTAKVLLDHGADPNAADEDGKTPLQHSLKYVNYSYGSGAHKAVAKLLIDRGAKHHGVNTNMVTSSYPCSIL